jgi:hypothetical protein
MMSIGRAAFGIGACVLLAGRAAFAFDGGFAAEGSDLSYYEHAAEGASLTPSASATADGAASGGLPTSLYAIDAAGGVTYHDLGRGAWQVDIAVARRPHEHVDAVYDLVLALPLPVGSTSGEWRIEPKVSSSPKAEPIVYGGEAVVLKRNVPLENAWLPVLAGSSSGLPDLSRSGYAWTLWDAIVRYDATAGATLEAFGTFRYAAGARVGAPDAENSDNAAYVITWIPTLEGVPPFAIRLDVVGAGKE